MQPDSARDLIPAWQDGDLSAARQIVAMHQSEAIYVSYLLTGERDPAIALAETAFLSLLNQSRTGDPDVEPRVLLLNLIAQSFLRGDYRERTRPDSAGLLLEPAPARFHVDDRRTLLLAALGRLDTRERAMLILRDFSGLATGEITRLQERRGEPLVAPMETARQRVRQSLDIPAGDPLRPAFVEATFSAPHTDLWSRIEHDVAAIQQRSRKQTRLISAAIIGVILAILAGGTLALLGGGNDETTSSSAGSQPGQQPASLPAGPTVGQSIDREPEPNPTMSVPQASVPSWLLMETTRHQQGAVPERAIAVVDPSTGQTLRLPSNSPIRLARGADQVHFSPDGYQMVLLREEAIENGIGYYLTSFSTDSIGRQWETEILTLTSGDGDPGILNSTAHVPVRFTSAITSSRVYTALLTTDSEPRIEIQSFFSRNGMPRGSVEIELPRQTINTRVFHGNILLHAPPGSDMLYLLVESFGDSSDEWRATLLTFDRSDLALVSERSISADPSTGYWLWSAQMTADGSALYGVHENRSGNQVRVQFIEFETGQVTSLSLPFETSANRLESVLTVPSHDGSRIFVLDRAGHNVAEVNLVERRIERIFPLDRNGFSGERDVQPDDWLFGYGSALSADGSQLFVASWNNAVGVNQPEQDGIWIVDITTWSLIGFVQIDGYVDGIFLSPADNVIYAQVWRSAYSSPDQDLVRLSTGSQPVVLERIEMPRTGNDYFTLRSPWQHYMNQFGRSPAIDQVALSSITEDTTLPRLEVITSPSAVSAGQNATVEVRFVDPATGEPLEGEVPGVRYDPQVSLSATLRAEGEQSQVIILGETRPAVYRGTATLPGPGVWSIDLSLTAADSTSVNREGIAQVEVSPSFSGSDGRSYAFHISTLPQDPLINHEVVLRLELVDIVSGDPIPEDVTVNIELDGEVLSDLPDRLDVTLLHPEPGYLTARMVHTGNGVYHGAVRFWASGTWSPSVRVQGGDGTVLNIPVNTIAVGTP